MNPQSQFARVTPAPNAVELNHPPGCSTATLHSCSLTSPHASPEAVRRKAVRG